MKKLLRVAFILAFGLISCKETSKEVKVSEKSTKKVVKRVEDDKNSSKLLEEEEFEINLKNKPKLFSDFWSGMSKDDYSKVYSILLKDGRGELRYGKLNYKVGECYSSITPEFKNEKLYSIELSNDGCLYKLYEEKYNLPSLIVRSPIVREYTENNPDFDPVDTYYYKGKQYRLPEVFNDKTRAFPAGQRIYKSKEEIWEGWSHSPYEELPRKLTISSGENIIEIDQKLSEGLNYYSYSLERTRGIMSYDVENEIAKGRFGGSPYSNAKQKYVRTNSRLRTVSITSKGPMKITYTSKLDYNKEKGKQLDIEKQLEQKRDDRINREKNRRQKALDEI